jgi:hypothetical protein
VAPLSLRNQHGRRNAYDRKRGGRTLVRPLVLLGNADTPVNATAWNVVKPDDGDTVFADNKGPLRESTTSEDGDELWIKFSAPVIYNRNPYQHLVHAAFSTGARVPILYTLSPMRFRLTNTIPTTGTQLFGRIRAAAVTADWDPATLTYNNRPTTILGGDPLVYLELDRVEEEDAQVDNDDETAAQAFVKQLGLTGTLLSGSVQASPAPTASVFKIPTTGFPAPAQAIGGYAYRVATQELREVVDYDGSDLTFEVSPAFDTTVAEAESITIIFPVYGMRLTLTSDLSTGSDYPRMELDALETFEGLVLS